MGMATAPRPGLTTGPERVTRGETVSSLRLSHDVGERRFWTNYNRVAFIVLAAESLAVLVYSILTPTGSSRPALEVIAALSAAAAIGALPFIGQIVKQSWRSQFSLGVALASGVLLAGCCHLDSGIDSPLVILLALPVVNAAIALPVRAVVLCSVAAALEVAAIGATDSHVTSSAAVLVILASFLAGMIVLALGWVTSRSRLESDKAALYAHVARLAQTDGLTGCINQGAFSERLESEIDRARRHGQPLSLLMIDVDLFKSFNDAHGHAAGDNALATVGAVLRRGCRSFDVVARVGGDEFAVILPVTPLASARQIAERLSDALQRPGGLSLTVSIGVGTLDEAEPTSKRLFRDADARLYRAKASGRDCVAWELGSPSPMMDSGGQGGGTRAEGEADTKRLEENVRQAKGATADALAILDTLDSSSSVGLGFIDCDYRIVRLNAVLAAVYGGKVEDQIGRRVADVVPARWPALEPAYRRVLETGEPLISQEVSSEMDGHLHHWLTNLYPVDVNGDRMGICLVAIDITDRRRLEESQDRLTRSVVGALAGSVEMRDPRAAGHQHRVAGNAVAIARELW
jgi:diguanylate cyclase (GGDEF)-like protein/PAS domain S-box-containing protein